MARSIYTMKTEPYNRRRGDSKAIYVWLLILSNLLVFQLGRLFDANSTILSTPSFTNPQLDIPFPPTLHDVESRIAYAAAHPLSVPQGSVPNLPSIREANAKVDQERKIYGGAGDKLHLGGFTAIDAEGISPGVWTYMLEKLGVRSVLDVGCGPGISSRWFLEHGADVLCVEGSHDAVTQSYLPSSNIVEHDYARGAWWPNRTFDAAWSVEFLEHVSLQYHPNYIATFRKAAILFVTSSRWGGWHHVEVHQDDWWIRKYESYGFRYDDALTKAVKATVAEERQRLEFFAPANKTLGAAHVGQSVKVFINPAVAALPAHLHLFFEHGCFRDYNKGVITNRKCGEGRQGWKETVLPPEFYPLKVNPQDGLNWQAALMAGVGNPGENK